MISVIIPAYNEEAYIEKTLQSVTEQNTRSEIIVVDGGSTDRTVEIAKRYADDVLVVRGDGVSRARNIGAKAASGDVLLFLDADTWLHAGTLETIQTAFTEGATGVCGNVRSDGPLHARIVYKITSATALITSWLHVPLFYGLCMAWRRDAFERNGGFDEGTRVGEDIKLTLALHNSGRCVWLRNARVTTSSRRLRGRWFFLSPYVHLKNFFKMVFLKRTDSTYRPVR